MNYRFVIFFTIYLFFIGVSGQQRDSCRNHFSNFVSLFYTDRVFQFSRIIFPLKIIHKSDGEIDDGYEEYFLTRIEWAKTEFILDSIVSPNNYTVLNSIVSCTDSVAIFERKGIDTGLSQCYWFRKQNGQWVLFKIVDEST